MLERRAVKVASVVLRGRGGGDAALLPGGGESNPCHLAFAQRIQSTNTPLIVCLYSLTAQTSHTSRSIVVVQKMPMKQRANDVDAFVSDAWRRCTSWTLHQMKSNRTENATSLHT